MSKPIYLREETWLFIQQKLANLQGKTEATLKALGYVLPPQDSVRDDDFLPLLAEQPGPFLLYSGILKYPSLLQGTILELTDGHEYVITKKAAQALKNEDPVIVVRGVHTKALHPVLREDVIYALENGLLFDQVSRKILLTMQ